MTESNSTIANSTSWSLTGAWSITLAMLLGITTAFVGGLLIGWASSGRPSTLSQAIQQAAEGALPTGTASPSSERTQPTSDQSAIAPASAYDLAFFGTVSSVAGRQLDVETKAGQVTVRLTGDTRFATVSVTSTSGTRIIDATSVLIIPKAPIQGSTEPVAGTVVLLPT